MMLSELALPLRISLKNLGELRQQMSRSNNGLVSLLYRLCVNIVVLRVCFFSFYMYRPSYYGLWLPDINSN